MKYFNVNFVNEIRYIVGVRKGKLDAEELENV